MRSNIVQEITVSPATANNLEWRIGSAGVVADDGDCVNDEALRERGNLLSHQTAEVWLDVRDRALTLLTQFRLYFSHLRGSDGTVSFRTTAEAQFRVHFESRALENFP